MNGSPAVVPVPAAKGPQDSATTTQHGNSQLPSSPVPPLIPLDPLQNQRRRPIPDLSLHVATPATARQIDPSSPLAQSRPSSAYRFGEPSETSTLPHIRNLLRSPSVESVGNSPDDRPEHPVPDRTAIKKSGAPVDKHMEVDVQAPAHLQSRDLDKQDSPSSETSELNGRRASLAGTKRKMSFDTDATTSNPSNIDPQLADSSLSNEPESEGPTPKRRNSVFDTRIAHLSLNERRNSMDTRTGSGQQWWSDETREVNAPASSAVNPALANTPLLGYSPPASEVSGNSPHGRPPAGIAPFAWPANPPPNQAHVQPPAQNEASTSMATTTPYDPLVMIPQPPFPPDRRMSTSAAPPESMSTPSAAGPARQLRSRSRPPSRIRRGEAANNASQSPSTMVGNVIPEDAPAPPQLPPARDPGSTPYSRSPELRVTHKLAERKRRREMKELFDELRDQLPADRGMKASKWEILSKAIDFIVHLKQNHEDMRREIDMLRHEIESMRQGIPPFPPGAHPPHPVVYGHPPLGVPPFPPPPGPGGPPPTHPAGPPPGPHHPPSAPRPDSSQNTYPPGTGPSSILPHPSAPPQNGNAELVVGGAARTDTPS